MDDSLRLVWDAAKPIYESGEPERALARCIAASGLPSPEPLAPTALTCIGMTEGDVRTARAVIAAYNRSNGLNLMALAALIAPTTMASGAVRTAAFDASPAQWPPLPPLLSREAIAADTWDIIRRVNAFGALARPSRADPLRVRAAAIARIDQSGECPTGCPQRRRRCAYVASASDNIADIIAQSPRRDHRLCQKSYAGGAHGCDWSRSDFVARSIAAP
jgi:hypothetical protein